LISLSEQNLLDCDSYNSGCEGGSSTVAYHFVIEKQNGKFNLESDYPYTGGSGNCAFNAAKGVTQVNFVYTLPNTGNEGDLAGFVYSKGPVSCMVDASHTSFRLYSSGVYNEPACSTLQLTQPVCTVGYGADGTNAYWIVKNSWGTGWGEQGYIRMSRNRNNQCGIASETAIPAQE
jgi:cathepsin L